MSNTTLTFHGGAGTVTGANFLLETEQEKILIDCGLMQGEAFCDACNYDPFGYDPDAIKTLIVTHAHTDHIGRIPRLVAQGFKGSIISTSATRDLAELLFEDALGLMQEEARKKNREPLYTQGDVNQMFSLWQTKEYGDVCSVGEGIEATLRDAGHILGSAFVELTRGGRNIVFSGDLGNSPDLLLPDTEKLEGAHYAVVESVYGDREHEDVSERTELLRDSIEAARKRGGALLIPSFSIQRTQVLLFELNRLVEEKEIEPIPVFLDSPLAIKVTDVFMRYPHLFNKDVQDRLTHDPDVFSFPQFSETAHIQDSRDIAGAPSPKIIIAGAGMSHGGRIREHEKRYLSDPDATILFVGFQSLGSLGRRIQDGEKIVMIDKEKIPVRAHIDTIRGYSAHRDRNGLLDFVADSADTLEEIFVAMGEPKSSQFLAQRIQDFLDVKAVVPDAGSSYVLNW